MPRPRARPRAPGRASARERSPETGNLRARSTARQVRPVVGACGFEKRWMKWFTRTGRSPRALAQRRNGELDGVDPVVEVLAEPPRGDLLAQIAMRRRHDSRRRPRAVSVAPERLDRSFLQDAQELDLRRLGQLRHLVEEQRPAVGRSEASRRRRSRPVKAPRSWPNSSASSSVSGKAAQLTATKAFAARGLRSCSARATSSLPVPLSPRMTTDASLGATASRRLIEPLHLGRMADQPVVRRSSPPAWRARRSGPGAARERSRAATSGCRARRSAPAWSGNRTPLPSGWPPPPRCWRDRS